MSKQSLCTNVNNLSTRTNNKLLRVHSLPNSNRAATFSHQLSFLLQPLFALLSPRRDVVSCLRRCIYTPGPRDRGEDETLSPSHVIFQTQLFLPQSIQNTKQHFQFTVVPQRITSYPCNHGCMFPFPSVLRWS